MVSIITVNYNQLQHTCALLDSIRQQHTRAIEVILVDNASKESPEAYIRETYPEVIFVRSERNLGFAGGNNLGIGHATGQYLFFVNNDTELTYFCIERLRHFLTENPECGAVSPLICYFNEEPGTPDIIQYAGMTPVSSITARNLIIGEGQKDAGQFLIPEKTAYAHGAAMMVPRAVLDTVGTMHDGFFLYYEELDWCERIRRAGYSIWVNPHSRIYHKESATVGNHSPLKSYFMYRNRLLFVKRNYHQTKVSFYFYMWMIVFPKAIFKYVAQRRFDKAKAVIQAYFWHFFCIKNDYEKMVPLT